MSRALWTIPPSAPTVEAVKKGSWLLLTGVILLLAIAGGGFEGFLLAAALLGIPYLAVCVFSPRTRHTGFGACNGSGEARSRLYPWAYHRCRGCGGTGRQVRIGARMVGPEHVKAEHQRQKAAQKARKRDHSWR
jgi:hypothetical protein